MSLTWYYRTKLLICMTYLSLFFNRACLQHSHNAIFHWTLQNYSVKVLYAIIDWGSGNSKIMLNVGYSLTCSISVKIFYCCRNTHMPWSVWLKVQQTSSDTKHWWITFTPILSKSVNVCWSVFMRFPSLCKTSRCAWFSRIGQVRYLLTHIWCSDCWRLFLR